MPVYFAKSPCIIQTDAEANGSEFCTLRVYQSNNVLVASLKKEFFTQTVSFDISAILQGMFLNELAYLDLTDTDGVDTFADFEARLNLMSMMNFKMSFQNDNGHERFINGNHIAVNGRKERNSNPLYSNSSCKFLSLLPARFYDALPFSVSVLSAFKDEAGLTNYVTTEEGTFIIKQLDQFPRRLSESNNGEPRIITMPSQDGTMRQLITSTPSSLAELPTFMGVFELILFSSEEFVTVADSLKRTAKKQTKKVEYLTCSDYSKAVYLTWVNQIGGVEYYLFDLKFKDEVKKENANALKQLDAETFETYLTNTLPTYTHTLHVATKYIDKEEYTALKSLFFADSVQLYDMETDQWKNVVIDNATLTEYSTQTRFKAEFTIILPE